MSRHVWGESETEFFYSLTPERILEAVEAAGYRCTGRVLAMNSMENRVYDVELDVDDPEAYENPSERFRIVKFYRPGRWSLDQILDEHDFLLDLWDHEIPVTPPVAFEDGDTVRPMPDGEILYSIFPKRGGRAPQELDDEQLARLGRLIARVHNVGQVEEAEYRLTLGPETYGLANLEWLLENDRIPAEMRESYAETVEAICEISAPWFEATPVQRIHGDCHLGNILWRPEGMVLIDFDDMAMGPCAQDLWLLVPGRDDVARQQWEVLLEGYEMMRRFDRRSLRLVEPLRALRFVHFSAWIAKRWEDPAFPDAFPEFGSQRYWNEQLMDLKEQLALVREQAERDRFAFGE